MPGTFQNNIDIVYKSITVSFVVWFNKILYSFSFFVFRFSFFVTRQPHKMHIDGSPLVGKYLPVKWIIRLNCTIV